MFCIHSWASVCCARAGARVCAGTHTHTRVCGDQRPCLLFICTTLFYPSKTESLLNLELNYWLERQISELLGSARLCQPALGLQTVPPRTAFCVSCWRSKLGFSCSHPRQLIPESSPQPLT